MASNQLSALAAAVLALTLSAAGCANFNMRGDGFAQDETFDSTGQYRTSEDSADLFGFSNKARQIERDCGAR